MKPALLSETSQITEKRETNIGELLRKVLPQDLIRFGLIPEFIGRVPVVVSLDELDREAMIRILTEPKNAIIRQYQKLFELDGVELTFDREAVEAIADKTIERRIGARGLRSIIENSMMDVMFDLPSEDRATACLITKETIEGEGKPKITYGSVPEIEDQTEKEKTTRRRKKNIGEPA